MGSWPAKLRQADLARSFGTPLYVLNSDQLVRNAREFIALTGDAGSVAYPVKANPSLAVLRILAELGCAADCAAEHEVRAALMAGFRHPSIIYNTPVPDLALMADLYLAGATVVADSEPILSDLARRVGDAPALGRLLVRVNPREPVEYLHQEDWQSLTSHSSSTAKFGIPSEELADIVANCPRPVDGLHIHVGTQMDHLSPFLGALQLLHRLGDEIASRTGRPIRVFDLGGGLGIGFQAGQRFPSATAYVEALRPDLRPGCQYLVEPGHALVGDAVAMLAEVCEVKEIRGRRWALLNVGTDQLAKVTLLHWHHQILGPDGSALPAEGPDAIGGPHCFAGDVLLPHTRLGALRVGDTVLIENVGAYCFALANHFNGRHGPAHIQVDDSGQQADRTHRAEDWFFEPGQVGYLWAHAGRPRGAELDLAVVNALSSSYLRLLSAQDAYSFLSVEDLGSRAYRFGIQAESPLGVVSMPFAVRMAGDAAIIATLHGLGKGAKDMSVWGTRLAMTAAAHMPTDQPLDLRLATTPPVRRNGGVGARATAHWEFNGGVFHGSFRLAW